MKIIVISGKGGVGKTTITVSLGTHAAVQQHKKIAIVDYDGGHSVPRTFRLKPEEILPNQVISFPNQIYKDLSIAVIEPTGFKDIAHFKDHGLKIKDYMKQFSGDLGIVPFTDMVQEFFGIPTDVEGSEKFSLLVHILCLLEEKGFEEVYIDVEPTAGLERLLRKSDRMERSLKNLQKTGWGMLTTISVGWPDIATYLKGDYIKQADMYTQRIVRAVNHMKNAQFFLVCTPEFGPVQQTFEVRKIIENFGGTVYGCIINNVRKEYYEEKNIAILEKHALPTVQILRQSDMQEDRRPFDSLLHIGEEVNQLLETV